MNRRPASDEPSRGDAAALDAGSSNGSSPPLPQQRPYSPAFVPEPLSDDGGGNGRTGLVRGADADDVTGIAVSFGESEVRAGQMTLNSMRLVHSTPRNAWFSIAFGIQTRL